MYNVSILNERRLDQRSRCRPSLSSFTFHVFVISETIEPIETKLCKNDVCENLYRDSTFRLDPTKTWPPWEILLGSEWSTKMLLL
jgi:hypothetical protein